MGNLRGEAVCCDGLCSTRTSRSQAVPGSRLDDSDALLLEGSHFGEELGPALGDELARSSKLGRLGYPQRMNVDNESDLQAT